MCIKKTESLVLLNIFFKGEFLLFSWDPLFLMAVHPTKLSLVMGKDLLTLMYLNTFPFPPIGSNH